METIRDKMIHHGASVDFSGSVCYLRVNASFPYQQEMRVTLEKLRTFIHIEQTKRSAKLGSKFTEMVEKV